MHNGWHLLLHEQAFAGQLARKAIEIVQSQDHIKHLGSDSHLGYWRGGETRQRHRRQSHGLYGHPYSVHVLTLVGDERLPGPARARREGLESRVPLLGIPIRSASSRCGVPLRPARQRQPGWCRGLVQLRGAGMHTDSKKSIDARFAAVDARLDAIETKLTGLEENQRETAVTLARLVALFEAHFEVPAIASG